MDALLTILKLAFPALPIEILMAGVKAVNIAIAAFAGDEARREAEIAVIFAELGDGKIPSIVGKVIA